MAAADGPRGTGSGEELRDLLSQLSRRFLAENMRNVAAHNEVRQLVVQGVLDQSAVDRAYVEYARQQGARFFRRAADSTIRYYGELAALGTEWSKGFYEQLLHGLSAPPPEPPRPVYVELSARAGEWADTRFELTNEQDAAVSTTLVVAPFRGPAGEVFRPVVVIEPASLILAPGAVAAVSLRVLLEPQLFRAGRIYTSTVEVDGHPGLSLILSAWALPPESPRHESAPPGPPSATGPFADTEGGEEPAGPPPAPVSGEGTPRSRARRARGNPAPGGSTDRS
ncbi:hypothetical protein JOD57_003880 [Geodermatophilus bullaregiensis]|uniref:hypothetical protein n=1 Tax=Geodermatophilus bullaregiensis TaxID=1564160 RepID=UPI00195B039A|nr:hypothetical protein [Geodermatophilus bullaregiensis]MBM7808043.1 hypothetical protein [Geodermatophilus bullaregiensis]